MNASMMWLWWEGKSPVWAGIEEGGGEAGRLQRCENVGKLVSSMLSIHCSHRLSLHIHMQIHRNKISRWGRRGRRRRRARGPVEVECSKRRKPISAEEMRSLTSNNKLIFFFYSNYPVQSRTSHEGGGRKHTFPRHISPPCQQIISDILEEIWYVSAIKYHLIPHELVEELTSNSKPSSGYRSKIYQFIYYKIMK